ncbi:MAG TPA: L-lactate dehydrogenase [Firmicutes bacterium]|nr:L-lactate dehydrogenase [Bacillota bacterium]
MKKGKKITILGAGNVGATIAYTLAMDGMASEILLIDINEKKANGEAMDIFQGTPFCAPVNIHAGGYPDALHSDVVIVTVGLARKPGQTRIDLAQANVDIIKSVMPQITQVAPDAVYVVVSNPVDIITYAILKTTRLSDRQVFGSGTMLDSARLRSRLAEHVGLNSKNVHAYVFGEHGDTSLIPWSLTTIAGMEMDTYCTYVCDRHNHCGKEELKDIEEDVRTAGAKVIAQKGATFYAIALSVRRICECILRDTDSVMTVSAMIHNQYGINDVCLSLPFVVGAQGIRRAIVPPLTEGEEALLHKSADALKDVISQLNI